MKHDELYKVADELVDLGYKISIEPDRYSPRVLVQGDGSVYMEMQDQKLVCSHVFGDLVNYAEADDDVEYKSFATLGRTHEQLALMVASMCNKNASLRERFISRSQQKMLETDKIVKKIIDASGGMIKKLHGSLYLNKPGLYLTGQISSNDYIVINITCGLELAENIAKLIKKESDNV